MKNYIQIFLKVVFLFLGYYCIILSCFVYTSLPLFSQIKYKTNSDDTIEYYNVQQNKKSKDLSIDLSNNPYDDIIIKICKQENIDPQIIRCIIKVESNFNKDAVSVAGAMGLMQLMQETAQAYNVNDPFDPEQNIRAGIKHFKSLLWIFRNDIILSLAAYHAGLGIVKKNMAVPNIKSTIEYVNAVMKLYNPKAEHNYSEKIEKLYMQILPDGTINITNSK